MLCRLSALAWICLWFSEKSQEWINSRLPSVAQCNKRQWTFSSQSLFLHLLRGATNSAWDTCLPDSVLLRSLLANLSACSCFAGNFTGNRDWSRFQYNLLWIIFLSTHDRHVWCDWNYRKFNSTFDCIRLEVYSWYNVLHFHAPKCRIMKNFNFCKASYICNDLLTRLPSIWVVKSSHGVVFCRKVCDSVERFVFRPPSEWDSVERFVIVECSLH